MPEGSRERAVPHGSGLRNNIEEETSTIEYFGLELEEKKSRLIEFGRFAQEDCRKSGTKTETFDFLGFTHYCSKSRNGKFRVKRKTSRKIFAKKCKEVHGLIREMRHMRIKDITAKLNQILVGYYHYYGITDNSERIGAFRYNVMKSLFYWLNRRSQKKVTVGRNFST